MKELYLIYVNYVGKDYRGMYLYEFLFSDSIENCDGDDWDVYPASSRPSPPFDIFIKKASRLESELKLDVIQESSIFAVWDAKDGVIALAWEDINSYETYPEHRLCFKFGETQKQVEDKLYEKDLILVNLKENERQKK